MKALKFIISIHASQEKVWKALWDKESYKAWTNPFCEGSYYEADHWKQGGKIHFLTPSGEGMFSILDVLEENKFVSFRHLGTLKDFKELPLDDETNSWSGAMESYNLQPTTNGVDLVVEVEIIEQHLDFMNQTFPLALQELKRLAEEN